MQTIVLSKLKTITTLNYKNIFLRLIGAILIAFPFQSPAQESLKVPGGDTMKAGANVIKRIEQLNNAAASLNKDSTNLALVYSHEAYLLGLNEGNKKLQTISLLNLSEGYLYNDIYDQALQYGYAALDIGLKLGDAKLLADCYTNLGWIFYDTENLTFSMQNHLMALNLYISEGLKKDEAISLNAIGLAFQMKGNDDSAKIYFQQSLHIATQQEMKGMMSAALNNIGICENSSGNYEKALQYFKQALATEMASDDVLALAETNNQMAFSYIKLKNYKKADSLLSRSRELINRSTSNTRKEKLLDNLSISSQLYEALGDYSKAFGNLKEYFEVSNQIVSRTKSEMVATLKLKREAWEKEEKVRELEVQNKLRLLQRNAFIGGILLLIIIGMLLISRIKQKARRTEELQEIKRQLIRQELENTQMEKEALNAKLEFKNTDLKNYALYISQRNELIREFVGELRSLEIINQSKGENAAEFNKVIRKFQQNLEINSEAQEFNVSVDEMQKDFFFNLLQKYPELTDNERRLCGQIRLNLSIKEIASLNNISVKSVEMARYRLRKQLNLQTGEDLNEFLKKF